MKLHHFVTVATLGLFYPLLHAEDPTKSSILIVNIDDLNDWNEVLKGHPQAITPNLKRLADMGLTFSNAICSSPVCFPSRTAVFTGIRPDRSGAVSNFNWKKPWRFYAGDAVTLPKHLGNLGWHTFGVGKNLHSKNGPEFDKYRELPWRADPPAIKGSGYHAGPLGWGVAAVPYEKMPDHLLVSQALDWLAEADGPTLMAVGIYKPHVKWILPQSCFDKFPLDRFQLPAVKENDLSDLAPRLQLLAHNEAKFGPGYHAKLKKDGQDKAWARAYLAAVTFADEQLGRVLDAWFASPQSKGGYIVLWSDHGFMLGEKEAWGKFKPWNDAIRSNLMIAGPGIPEGVICDRAVSLQDIYPTLIDLLKIDPPANQIIDGNSLTPLINDPKADWNKPVVMSHEEDGIRYDVVMDNRYRMTRLITGETELYDLKEDPNEWTNLADLAEHDATIERLEDFLTFSVQPLPKDGWFEAETLPHQTSADLNHRENYHYPHDYNTASGGKVLVAELIAGKSSYIDFVWRADTIGDYSFTAIFEDLPNGTELIAYSSPVVEDARQADADFKMEALPTGSITSTKTPKTLVTKNLGSMKITHPGLQLLRFMSVGENPLSLRIDRLGIRPLSSDE